MDALREDVLVSIDTPNELPVPKKLFSLNEPATVTLLLVL